ncbi:MAG: hypothetical protein CM1200mP1_16020 [Candidatus Neomarinimicrobiota bacterium]|nr:MAG: hypothetical protein CM1200mP1_16020 [Candidatus Neomarinimicrobiota bacterium]|tara:strand:- start:4658 stop:5500 length:843 start_codon:yes stop_codon:yes gene_type:complete
MLFHFKKIVSLFFISQLMASGTQFLAVPPSAYDLMYFHTVWRNPAALNQINRAPRLALAYGNWLAGIESFSFQWQGQMGKGSGGLDIRYLGMDDIELRPNKPTSKPLGHYVAYGLSTKGSYSIKRDNFQFGVGINLINFQIYQESTSGIAFDFGLGWDINQQIRFSFSGLNIGSINPMINESPELPRRIIGSLDYHPKKYSLFLAVESNQLVKEPILYSGFNSNYKNLIFGTTIMSNKDVNVLSGGIGFSFGIYSITYGFQWGNQHLGMPQIIDISIRLP